jgi:hypothetical protein
MPFREMPASAAWRHHGTREGFESVFFDADSSGYRLAGHTAAAEAGRAWAVRYVISLDNRWITRTAQVWGRSLDGEREVTIEGDGSGRWRVNGARVPELDGCLEVDLEFSACTNSIPVHRLKLAVDQSADAPAVYVRAFDLGVERLEQHYRRRTDDGDHQCYDHGAPSFDFEARLVYDTAGLVLIYPDIATRVF